MAEQRAHIWHSTSVKNAGKLLSANIIAQALALLVYPILTRQFAAEDFALLSLFSSIAVVLSLIATAEYQYAIVLPEDDSKARALVHMSALIMLGMTVAVCLSLPFARPIAGLFKAPELARWWWLMPLCVFGLSAWNILNYWYIRRKAFSRISGYQITQSVFAASGKIGFGALGWLRGGMIIATSLAPLLSLAISIGLAWKKHIRELLSPRWEEIKTAAKEYANFPKFNLPRALVNSVGQSLPVWLLTPQFGLEAVGRFALAFMVSFVPLNIIARACYQVLFQRVSELVQQRKSIRPVLMRFCLWTGGMMAVGMTVIYFIVPALVTFLFGAEWIASADIIRALFPYLILTPICGSICFLSDVFAKQKIAMWMETAYVLAIGAALGTGIWLNSFMGSVSLFAWTRFAYLAIQLVWFISLARSYNKSL